MDLSNRSHHTAPQTESVNPSELYQVILGASSQDVAQLQASAQRLKQLLDMFGSYDALQEIASRKDVPNYVRKQAMIQFKNAVTSHWRSRKYLNDEHRARIRQRCLSFVDEEDETIAACNKIVVCKIARWDYPTNWPNLIGDLVQLVELNLQKRYVMMQDDAKDFLMTRRSLQLLNGLIKEFASVKVFTGMKTMAQLSGQLRPLFYGYYTTLSSSINSITHETIGTAGAHDNALLAHLIYKCMAKIAAWLWNKSGKLSAEEAQENFTWVHQLFQDSLSQLKTVVNLRKSAFLAIAQNASLGTDLTKRTLSVITRHLRAFGKFFRRIQQLSQERFTSLPTSGELVLFYWGLVEDSTNYPQTMIYDSDEAVFPVRILVQGLVLFKDSLSQWTPLRRNGVPNKNSLSEDFVRRALQLLVTRFMPLNTSDLASWMDDPEEWVNLEEKENDQWEYEIRACAERVLVQLCNQFPDFVVPFLRAEFEKLAPTSATDLDAIVQKESLYCAVGRCAIRLKSGTDPIQFDNFIPNFTTESKDPNPSYPIIKRRIAWLVGKLVADECISPSERTWNILVPLLQQGTDTVVRLTTAAALRECVDSLQFEPNSFAPFLATAVNQLIQLIGEAETLESKRKVDETLNTVIEQSGLLILPFMNVITAPIPEFWVAAENDLLFKGSLLVTVTKLVDAVKEHATALVGLVVPLVRQSLEPPVIVQLDSDALNLWLSTLRNITTVSTTDGSAQIRELFPKAVELLETNLDLLGTLTAILESHFLLDASWIMQNHGVALFTAYSAALRNKIIPSNAKEVLQSLQLLFQLAPSELWGEPLHVSGLFRHLLQKLIEGEDDTLVLVEHIHLFSRIILSNRQIFLQLMTASAQVANQNESNLFSQLMDAWWGKFDNMSEPRHRKLTALGVAALVSTAQPIVLQRLSGEIFNIWLDVFGELKEAQQQASEHESLDEQPPSPTSLVRFWDLETPPDSYFQGTAGTAEYSRRQAVYSVDPVRTTPLVAYVGAQLGVAESTCGAGFGSYINSTDPTVLTQIKNILAQG